LKPENTLKRGYSITSVKGKIIRDIGSLKAGDMMTTEVYRGIIESKIELTKQKNGKET